MSRARSTPAELLTTADVARTLGLSADMVRVLAREGRLRTAFQSGRGIRLFRREDVEALAAERAGGRARHHLVHFYDHDDSLRSAVTAYVHEGLAAGAPVVVIAIAPHRDAFTAWLEAAGCDVATAIASGQLTFLDAHEILERLMVGGRPDPGVFRAALGRLVAGKVAGARSRLRVYVETVDLLCRDGRVDAARELEALWNDLADEYPFTLLCAYATASFPRGEGAEPLRHGEELHTTVRQPDESDHQDLLLTGKEEIFRHMVTSVRDYAIFMLDVNGHVVTWNAGAERIKGYRAEEILGQHFSRFYPPEDEGRVGRCAGELEVAAREGKFEEEGWRVRKDGSRFWASVVITAVRNDAGALIGFAKVTRDLTERRRAQEEQAGRIAAEQANRAKDEFLAVLGHELRNPLAPIVTALQLMKLRGDTRTSKEQEVIDRQVKHMMRLVDDLLDMSRITRGAIELKRRRLDLRDVVAKGIEVASPLLEQRGHHLEIDVPPGEMPVEGDEGRLTQVFGNLLVNAAKYTEPGGNIRVTVGHEAGQAVVAVRDDGAGIEREMLPRLFDLFVQGRGAERTQGGLGIGLTLVKRLVTMHGGAVTAESEGPGRGSTFTVRLPLAATLAPAAGAASASAFVPPLTGTPHRILVVDDNEDALVLLAEILTAIGHEVRTAVDAVSALERLREFTPEVAVLDIGLPVMDGYELAGKLRAELGAKAPRLIALSGYGALHDRRRSQKAGFDAHLVKPIEAQKLIETIASLMSARVRQSRGRRVRKTPP